MSSSFPNPDVYLNHFPPAQAFQFEVARNLCLAALGALIWDTLIYIADDYKICRSAFRPVTFCFVSSRIFALAFIALAVTEFTHPIANCNAMILGVGTSCLLTVMTTTYIFLQRIIAVHASTRWVQIVACILWLGTSATMSMTVFAAQSAHVPGTEYCAYSVVSDYLAAAGFVFFCFDSFVFLAISYKIATTHSDEDAGITWEAAVSGRALPRISRSVLQGGQQYYLIMVSLHLPVSILLAIPSVPAIYKLMLAFPLVCLAASMAGRIFRNLKLETLQIESSKRSTSSNIVPLSRIYVQRNTVVSPPHASSQLPRNYDQQISIDLEQPKRNASGGLSQDVPFRTEVWDMK